jgi:hypothetical protein
VQLRDSAGVGELVYREPATDIVGENSNVTQTKAFQSAYELPWIACRDRVERDFRDREGYGQPEPRGRVN